jgi:hypothetical protein
MVRTRGASLAETGANIQTNPRPDAAEQRMVRMISRVRQFKEYETYFEKLRKGTLDVPGFMQEMTHEALMVLMETMRSEDERLAYDAARDVLDRAGHSKTQKIAVGHVHVDHNTSKRELINLIMTSARRAGMEVKDEEHVQGSELGTIDVTPSRVSDVPADFGGEARPADEVRSEGKGSPRDD